MVQAADPKRLLRGVLARHESRIQTTRQITLPICFPREQSICFSDQNLSTWHAKCDLFFHLLELLNLKTLWFIYTNSYHVKFSCGYVTPNIYSDQIAQTHLRRQRKSESTTSTWKFETFHLVLRSAAFFARWRQIINVSSMRAVRPNSFCFSSISWCCKMRADFKKTRQN